MMIMFLALLLFGPKKLPEIGKQVGKALGEFKRASHDLKRSIEDEMEKANWPRRWTRCPARGLPDQVICPDEIQSCRAAGVTDGCPGHAIRIRTRPDQPEYRGRSGFLHA